jgi:23S rRNA (uracil1939-C5)-methyltransferase
VQTCGHFGRCGGCSLLDRPIEEQLVGKQARAGELLRPWLGDLEPTITLPPRPPRHDRTTLLYPAQPGVDGLALGIYRRGSHALEVITDCRVQHKALTAFGVRIGAELRGIGLRAYDERTGQGLVRGVRARILPSTNELLVGAITTRETFPERRALATALRRAAEGLRDDQGRPVHWVGSLLNVNDQKGNALLGPTSLLLEGRGHQFDRRPDLTFRVSFASFYQLHRHAEAVLFRPALSLLGDVQGKTIVDGYGGVGTFALRLLRAGAAHVTTIESSPSACSDARHNTEHNGLADRTTIVERPFGEDPLPPCDVLLADPPRAGLQATGARAVLAARPARVLLVSCALESLARDLERLSPAYRVAALQLCDLFPHTEHVEAVTLLERR